MPALHQITHQNTNTEQKVNFFANYFDFVTKNVGVHDQIELETHLSLVEKLLFQLIHNSKKRSHQYILSYLGHSLMRDEFFKGFSNYPNFKLASLNYIQTKDGKNLLKSLKSLKKELSKDYIDENLKNIISYLRCTHSLPTHKEEIKYHTALIVSEFILSGRSHEDLSKLFQKLLSTDMNEFPFPKHIVTDNEKDEFLKGRDFTQQFEGIKNYFFIKRESIYYLYRIGGYSVKSDFKEKYNKVTFISINHKSLDHIRSKYKVTSIKINDYFSDKYSLLAYVKTPFYNIDIGSQEAINLIREELDYLNLSLKGNGYIETFDVIYTPDFKKFGYKWNKSADSLKVGVYETQTIQDNPFKFLKEISFASKNKFLKIEPIAIKAFLTSSISDLWHYLEILMPEQPINYASNILLNDAEEINKKIINDYIYYAFLNLNNDKELFGISEAMFKDVRENFYFIDLKKLKKDIKNDFIVELIELNLSKYQKHDYAKAHKYYRSIFLEAYEQRNFYIHKAQVMPKSIIKLSISFQYLIKRLRWVIFKAMREQNGSKFDVILSNLNQVGNKLINS